MRLLWFTNIPLNAINSFRDKPIKAGGHWMDALLNELKQQKEISEICIVTAFPGFKDLYYKFDNIEYYIIPQNRFYKTPRKELKKIYQVIQSWNPDIIHIHGTERYFGLINAQFNLKIPVVISLQGLMSEYSKW